MIKCPDCGKELKSKRAYAGHAWLSHQKRPGWKFELMQKCRTLEAGNRALRAELEALEVKMLTKGKD